MDLCIRHQNTWVKILVLIVLFPETTTELTSVADTIVFGDVTFSVEPICSGVPG